MMKILLFIVLLLIFLFIVSSILFGIKERHLHGIAWLFIFATLILIFFFFNSTNIPQLFKFEFLKNLVDECCMLYILKIMYTLLFVLFIFNFVKHVFVCWKLEKLRSPNLTTFFYFFEKVLLICAIATLVYLVIPVAMTIQSYLFLAHFFGSHYELFSTLGNFGEFFSTCTESCPNAVKVDLGDADVMVTTIDGHKLLCVNSDKLFINEFGEVNDVEKALIKQCFPGLTFDNSGPLCFDLKPAENIVVKSESSLNITEVKK